MLNQHRKATQLFVNQSIDESFSTREDWMCNINSQWHYHEEVELICFHRGSGMQFVGDNISRFNAGDVVMVGSNLPHYWKYDEEAPINNQEVPYSTVIHFPTTLLGDPFTRLSELAPLKALIDQSSRGLSFRSGATSQLIEEIVSVSKTTGIYRLIALLQCLATFIQKQTQARQLSSIGFSGKVNGFDEVRINKIYAYTFLHFVNPIQLDQVADLVGMQPTSFCRFFKQHTGKTYSRFLTEVRISNACKKLIANPFQPIKNICYESGYRNFTSFNDSFRKITGMTPKVYREHHVPRKAT